MVEATYTQADVERLVLATRAIYWRVDRGPSGGREAEAEASAALKPFETIKDPE